MAKSKVKSEPTAEDATVGEGTVSSEAEDPKVAEAVEVHAEAAANVADLRAALAEAEATEVQARAELEALTLPPPPPPITGPRIKLEHTGEIREVRPGEERERRLLLNGRNYEHVSDVIDQGEEIWVYRQM